MGDAVNRTSIEWTDYTTNLIRYRDPEGRIVHGCIKVSAGCANCYASAWSARGLTGERGGAFTAKRQATLTLYFDDAEAQRILRTRVTGKRIFVGDMTDVFGEWVPDEMLDRMFAVFALRPDLTFQVLTKRPERMRAYFTTRDTAGAIAVTIREVAPDGGLAAMRAMGTHVLRDVVQKRWPLPNVWLGVSVEDQAAADERIPALLDTPAAVRFLSCEPLLEPVDLEPWLRRVATSGPGWRMTGGSAMAIADIVLDWVIVGGESGPGARPCDVGWIRDIVGQCRAAEVPVFVKQLGANPERERQFAADDIRDVSLELHDPKGGEPSEWPEDLRVREFPQ